MAKRLTAREAKELFKLAREAKLDALSYNGAELLDPTSEACKLSSFATTARQRLRSNGYWQLAEQLDRV